MPSGENPKSKANLAKGNRFNKENAREAQQKSAEVRRVKGSLNEALREALTPEIAMQITETVLRKARAGNLKAYELIRDGIGEKPTEKVEQISSVVVDLGELNGDSD